MQEKASDQSNFGSSLTDSWVSNVEEQESGHLHNILSKSLNIQIDILNCGNNNNPGIVFKKKKNNLISIKCQPLIPSPVFNIAKAMTFSVLNTRSVRNKSLAV